MKFIIDSRELLRGTHTGDAARLALRLKKALQIIEGDREAMRAAHSDIMKRYDRQAAERLANQLQVEGYLGRD